MQESLPSDAHDEVGVFDRFADVVSRVTARAWFFAACVALVVMWLPSFLIVRDIDTWQLLINSPTTVITFLLVGLAQNTATRSDSAAQKKLNALAGGLILVLELTGHRDSSEYRELKTALGMEQKEGS